MRKYNVDSKDSKRKRSKSRSRSTSKRKRDESKSKKRFENSICRFFFPEQKSALPKKVCLKIFMKIILVVPGLSRGDDQNLGQNLRQWKRNVINLSLKLNLRKRKKNLKKRKRTKRKNPRKRYQSYIK